MVVCVMKVVQYVLYVRQEYCFVVSWVWTVHKQYHVLD